MRERGGEGEWGEMGGHDRSGEIASPAAPTDRGRSKEAARDGDGATPPNRPRLRFNLQIAIAHIYRGSNERAQADAR